MNVNELKREGALYFENIQQGFDNYKYEVRQVSAQKAKEQLLEIWKTSNYEDGFVDFYYYTLKPEEQKKVETILEPDEILYLHNHNDQDDIIFPLSETLLSIVTKCNETAMLFSTIYFTNPASTWWGNYEKEYVVFYQ